MRIWCAVGTRPEIIKMEPVIRKLRENSCAPRLVYTGQHPDLAPPFFKEFGLTISDSLPLPMYAKSLPVQFNVLMSDFTTLLDKQVQPPQAVLAVGDTTTAAAVAMACFNMRIPFGHIEAGLRTYDNYSPYPEEFYRRIADVAATYRFAPTQVALDNLHSERLEGIVTGNTIIDALEYYSQVWDLKKRYDKLVIFTCHRREAFGAPVTRIMRALAYFAEQHPDYRILWPVHPNPQIKAAAEGLRGIENIEMCKPMGYKKFLRELARCSLLITDSGGLQEEASYFGKHVAVIRETTERPEGVAAGFCHICGHDFDGIVKVTEAALQAGEVSDTKYVFGNGNASEAIKDALL